MNLLTLFREMSRECHWPLFWQLCATGGLALTITFFILARA